MTRSKVLIIAATVCLVFVLGLEIGAAFIVQADTPNPAQVAAAMDDQGIDEDDQAEALAQLDEVASADDPPGLAIAALAMLDVYLLLTFGGLAASQFVPHRVMGRIVAPTNLVVSILVILAGIVLLITTITLLMLMVVLASSPPFGTITYLVRWGFFPRGSAQTLLGLVLMLKLVFVACAVLASPTVLKSKGLVALALTSLVVQFIVSFLHALVPVPLVSITDAVAAIIVIIAALVWSVVILVGSLVGTIRLIRLNPG